MSSKMGMVDTPLITIHGRQKQADQSFRIARATQTLSQPKTKTKRKKKMFSYLKK